MNKNIFNFKDRTAVITGGAQGFGLDIAKSGKIVDMCIYTIKVETYLNY